MIKRFKITTRAVPALCLLALILLLPAGRVQAHPHVFIAQKLHVAFDEKGLAGIKVFWQFDDMFSAMIAGDHDRDMDGQLSKDEVAQIKKTAFSYIAEYEYFVFVTIDAKPFKVQYIKDFNARLIQGKLIYEFFIPCHVAAGSRFKTIKIATYDPGYYSAIYFVENRPFTLLNSERFKASGRIEMDRETWIFHDTVNPWTLFVKFALTP